MTEAIRFIDLKTQYAQLKESVNARIQAVLDHGQYIMGPEVAEMEKKLEAYVGAECISVSSGTEALLIALMALGVRPGDEVITTPFTFAATAEVIALVGATPVFVDIEPDTLNIDPRLVEEAIVPGLTKAIIPVSLYGQTADMHALQVIADRHGLPIVEDAAQSFGATHHGVRSAGLSTFGCVSFFPSKPLGCYGDGGALFTADTALAKIAREIRVHGQERRYVHSRVGVGGRMDTIQCAVVLSKLERFEWEVERRKELGQNFIDRLRGHNSIGLITVRPENTCVWAQFTVRVADREAVVEALNARGIPTAVHYPIPLHKQAAYSSISRIATPMTEAERAGASVMSLPFHPYMDNSTQDFIVSSLLEITG